MPRKVLILFLLVLFAVSGYAQMGKLFDADQQISSSFTNQVYLDRDGFIWVATRNGLNRYDGYLSSASCKTGKDCFMSACMGIFRLSTVRLSMM